MKTVYLIVRMRNMSSRTGSLWEETIKYTEISKERLILRQSRQMRGKERVKLALLLTLYRK